MAVFPDGTPPIASRMDSILNKILAISWAQRVPTLIITNDKLAEHRLIRDPDDPTTGNNERPAPMAAPIGRTLILASFNVQPSSLTGFSCVDSVKLPSVSPTRRELVIHPLL